jgi:tetratricopeptide (TPR) repeat protein
MVLHQSQKAMQDYSLAIKIKPDDMWNYRMRANAFFQLKQPDAAVQDINKAMQLDPKASDLLMSRAYYYRHSGHFAEAIVDYTTLIDRDKANHINCENCFYYADRGACYKQMGNMEAAAKDFARAKELDVLGSLKSNGEPKEHCCGH